MLLCCGTAPCHTSDTCKLSAPHPSPCSRQTTAQVMGAIILTIIGWILRSCLSSSQHKLYIFPALSLPTWFNKVGRLGISCFYLRAPRGGETWRRCGLLICSSWNFTASIKPSPHHASARGRDELCFKVIGCANWFGNPSCFQFHFAIILRTSRLSQTGVYRQIRKYN